MATILTIDELYNLQDVSVNKDPNTVTPSIESAEHNYVKKLIGEPMYVYLLIHKSDDPAISFVQNILNGATYGEAGNQKIFLGLKKAISAYAFCDMTYKQSHIQREGIFDTRDGTTVTSIEGRVFEQVARMRKSANTMVEEVITYIKSIDTTSLTDEQKAVIESVTGCDNEPNNILNEWL